MIGAHKKISSHSILTQRLMAPSSAAASFSAHIQELHESRITNLRKEAADFMLRV